jgi:hypothetical protein
MAPHSNYENVLVSLIRGDMLCTHISMQMTDFTEKAFSRIEYKGRRSVKFLPDMEVFEIPHVNDFTDEEIDQLYYSRDELDTIQDDVWDLVDMLNLGIEYTDKNDFTKRGLVDLKTKHVRRRRRMRRKAYSIVFRFQRYETFGDLQGVQASEVMAQLYQECTAKSLRDARTLARKDEIAARSA